MVSLRHRLHFPKQQQQQIGQNVIDGVYYGYYWKSDDDGDGGGRVLRPGPRDLLLITINIEIFLALFVTNIYC